MGISIEAGDAETVLETYGLMVYKLALSQTRNRSDAQDVFQEVFLRLMKNKKPFASEEHLKAWLLRVTINCSKKFFMSSWYRKTEELVVDIPFEEEQNSELYYAVLKLPLKYRTVIHLFYYEQYSVAQIAQYLKRNESTVKSQLKRGREMLKGVLRDDTEEQ
ncbi:RNA polymerase sigma factor [[Clostridium] innocuum]|uniref:RNA polymerase sigma factor n=1 Tax=Clostridium innocuum TaxID=1522 RepID=UPI003258E290